MYISNPFRLKDLIPILNEIRPKLIVDFRDSEKHWYKTEIEKYKKKVDEELDFYSDREEGIKRLGLNAIDYNDDITRLDMEIKLLPITRDAEIFEDTGKAPLDKNKTIKELCQKIVALLKEKETVILICQDGQSTSRYIAAICEWWYDGMKPAKDIIKDIIRKRKDFITAKSKKQQTQINEIQKWIIQYENGIRGFMIKK